MIFYTYMSLTLMVSLAMALLWSTDSLFDVVCKLILGCVSVQALLLLLGPAMQLQHIYNNTGVYFISCGTVFGLLMVVWTRMTWMNFLQKYLFMLLFIWSVVEYFAHGKTAGW